VGTNIGITVAIAIPTTTTTTTTNEREPIRQVSLHPSPYLRDTGK